MVAAGGKTEGYRADDSPLRLPGDPDARIGPGSDESARVLEVRVAADGFLPHMVRNIVGALLDLGQGRRNPGWIDELLAERDRRFGSVMAPPQGLTLTRIGFSGDLLDDD